MSARLDGLRKPYRPPVTLATMLGPAGMAELARLRAEDRTGALARAIERYNGPELAAESRHVASGLVRRHDLDAHADEPRNWCPLCHPDRL